MKERLDMKKKKHQRWQNEFLKNCDLMNRSANTLKNYNADLDKFFMWYEGHYQKLITKMSAQIITEYKDFLTRGGSYQLSKPTGVINKFMFFLSTLFRPKSLSVRKFRQLPLAVASRKRHLSTLKNFFEFLKQTYEEENKDFLLNPVKSKIHNIKLKEIDTIPTQMLYKKEWNTLDETVQNVEDRLMIQLMYYAGLRLHEVCHITFKDIDFEHKALSLRRKGGKVHRLVPYQKSEIFYLCKILTNKNPTNRYLFTKKTNPTEPASLRSMHGRIKNIFKKTGLRKELTAHSFRKACATNYYLRTKDLLLVRDYLNHQDAKVTQTYIDKRTLDQNNYNAQFLRPLS